MRKKFNYIIFTYIAHDIYKIEFKHSQPLYKLIHFEPNTTYPKIKSKQISGLHSANHLIHDRHTIIKCTTFDKKLLTNYISLFII